MPELGIQERVLDRDKHLVIINIEFLFKVIRLNDITTDECVSRCERQLKTPGTMKSELRGK